MDSQLLVKSPYEDFVSFPRLILAELSDWLVRFQLEGWEGESYELSHNLDRKRLRELSDIVLPRIIGKEKD